MKDSKTASRYAKALLSLALEGGKLDSVYANMQSLSETIKGSSDLQSLIKNPVIKGEDKSKVFSSLFAKDFDDSSMNTINLLLKNKREGLLEEVASQFISQYKSHKNIVTAEVVSATKLDEELKSKVLSLLKHDGEVEIIERVDASLIGGFIVTVGDRQIDASIATKFKQLRKEISLN